MKHVFLAVAFASFTATALADDKNTPVKPADAAAAKDNEKKPQTKKHEGVWKPIAAVLGGVRLPAEVLSTITLTITGDNYEVTVEGEKESDKGTCTLDTSVTPHRMTIKSAEGPNKGKTFLAIYEMKDDESMRVCYDLSGKDFPQEFKAPKDSQIYLAGYRRQKAKG